jgi:plastocyanin
VLPLLAFAGLLSPSNAGEVRVNLSGNSLTGTFSPRTANINVGDHMVWIWASGTHTCTSGDSSTGNADFPNHWDTPTMTVAVTNTPAFSWKSTIVETVPYFCALHAPAMAGRVIVGSGISVADFRLTEVQYNEAAGHDKFEITNLGTAQSDFGRYRFAVGSTEVPISIGNIPLPPGATLTVHTNESGVTTATDIYLPAIGPLDDVAGSVAVYVPNTVNPLLDDPSQMIDYVEWGSGGQGNEATAVAANLWTAGAVAPSVATGHTIEFCGTRNDHAGFWFDSPTPTFSGSIGNCSAVPTHSTTWGRIKTLYR